MYDSVKAKINAIISEEMVADSSVHADEMFSYYTLLRQDLLSHEQAARAIESLTMLIPSSLELIKGHSSFDAAMSAYAARYESSV